MSSSENERADTQQNSPGDATKSAHYAPGSFVEVFHRNFSGNTYLVGLILLTVGHVFGVIANFSMMSLLVRGFVVLPVVSGWLYYFASKSPKKPEKVLLGVTLEKIDTIIGFASAIFIIIIYTMVYLFSGLDTARTPKETLFFIVVPIMFFIFSMAVPYAIYVSSVLRMLNDIKINITDNSFRLLRGIKVYTVLGSIGIAFNIFDSVLGRAKFVTQKNLFVQMELPSSLAAIVSNPSSSARLDLVLTLASCAGLIIKIITLNMVKRELSLNSARTVFQPPIKVSNETHSTD